MSAGHPAVEFSGPDNLIWRHAFDLNDNFGA
jgi:hypothetical protein